MKYAMLIYDDESQWATMTEDDRNAIMDEYNRFSADVADSTEGGEALHPVSSATSVRVRGGETLTTDGPFAETKEQLGGFYLINAENLDEAIAIAARIPGARTGTVEVRPCMEFPPREG